MIVWLTRETNACTLEQVHHYMSGRTSEIFGLEDRGHIREGKTAELMIYDYEALGYNRERYDVVNDMPDGGWRRVTHVEGMKAVLVNGVPTYRDGTNTGETPGVVVAN